MNIPNSLKEEYPPDPVFHSLYSIDNQLIKMPPRTLDPLYNLQEGVDLGVEVDR